MKLKYFIQPTPNPMVMKYIFNQDVKTEGRVTYDGAEECGQNPLAKALFAIPSLTKLHFFENVITVSQDGDADWDDMEDDVIELMHEHIADHDPGFDDTIIEKVIQDKKPLKHMTQPTPNPMAMKYIFNQDVKTKGKITYDGAEECLHNSLAKALFAIPNLTKLHFFENVITVSQNGDVDWDDLETAVMELMNKHFAAHDPDFDDGKVDEGARRAALPEKVQQIEEILDRTIRPGLQGDGGDIIVNNYDETENKVYVQYQGACTTCPSSTMGTLMAIKNFLRDEFDPKIEVETVQE
jgi:NFU1 iron-sulfur cluster scaffold homolog, mitochondrial